MQLAPPLPFFEREVRVKIKKLGFFLKLAWNFFLAGKTVKIGGKPITLPPLQKSNVDVSAADLGLPHEP